MNSNSKSKKPKKSSPASKEDPEDQLDPQEIELLEEMLERVGVEKWDVILIGDGSGSNYQHACGWGCVSITRATFKREVWAGCMSRGTVNLAEMLAYIQPLNCLVASEAERRKAGGEVRFLNVHIITDSEYVKKQGVTKNVTPKRNGAFWRIFDDYTRQGLQLHWHWIPRETVELNIFADMLSKSARKLIQENDVQERVETVNGHVSRTVYDFNPSHI